MRWSWGEENMERVRGELPAASGVPQRMSVVLTCGGDILCCLGEEQPGLDLQNALWSLRELQMDTGTAGWHCHPKPQAVGSRALSVIR